MLPPGAPTGQAKTRGKAWRESGRPIGVAPLPPSRCEVRTGDRSGRSWCRPSARRGHRCRARPRAHESEPVGSPTHCCADGTEIRNSACGLPRGHGWREASDPDPRDERGSARIRWRLRHANLENRAIPSTWANGGRFAAASASPRRPAGPFLWLVAKPAQTLYRCSCQILRPLQGTRSCTHAPTPSLAPLVDRNEHRRCRSIDTCDWPHR